MLEQRFVVAEQLRAINVKPSSILLEPVGRNTAPAVAVAAIAALRMDPNAVLVVAVGPCDPRRSVPAALRGACGPTGQG